MSEFKIGDVVVLKSGGPPMTVAKGGGGDSITGGYQCMWFQQGFPIAPNQSVFPAETLKLYADPA